MSMINKYKKLFFYFLLSFIFILGVFLRTNLFILTDVFEDDECRLAITMLNKGIAELFLPLGDAQSAPPVFMIFSKFLTVLGGYSEKVLHFIPFLTSILAVFLFYKIVKKYFSQKTTILLSTFLIAVNQQLLNFSVIFKQYSSDVLIGLLCLYFLPDINLKKLNYKKCVLLALGLAILPLCSLTSVFFITSFICMNFIKNQKDKEFYKKFGIILIPFIIMGTPYLLLNLIPSKINLDKFFPDYWIDGFWKLSLKDFIRIIGINLNFNFEPNKNIFFTLILFIWGSISCILDKSNKQNTSFIIVLTFFFALLSSLLHIYPMCGRVSLYLIPLFIMLIIKPLDKSKFPKFTFWICVLLIILSFYKYDFHYFYNLKDNNMLIKYSPKHLMQELKENFNPQKDIILCNSASTASFIFYSSKYKLYTEKIYEMDIRPATEENAQKYFSGLDKNQTYWLYLVKDYSLSPVFPFIENWVKNKKILYFKREKNSLLIKVEN